MILTSVILILRETLEAALMISIMAAISRHMRRGIAWLPLALGAGLAFALIYAANMRFVSGWFDYIGQEVVNAGLQISIGLAIVALAWMMSSSRLHSIQPAVPANTKNPGPFYLCAVLTVGLSVTREGAEIAVYLNGFLHSPENLQAVLVGGFIGAGIGVSVGVLVYYGLMALGGSAVRPVLLILLSLLCGNMLLQSAQQLIQADLLPGGSPLYDSSAWLPEGSIPGQLLYALVGYESRPSVLEAVVYLGGVVCVWLAAFLGDRRR